MDERRITVGQGKHQVSLHCLRLGDDLCLCFGGGEKPHIGAVALATPRQSLRGDGEWSASASVLCVTGHKDDALARTLALRAASRLRRMAVVTVGLHVDAAGADDIALLSDNCHAALEIFFDLNGKGHE
jgi:hypothetical protein